MLSKQQFGSLIKDNFLWPGYNWYLSNTIDGLESASNIYFDGVVEIFIDYLYNQYLYVDKFTNILDINNADSDKQLVRLRVKNSLPIGTIINVYGTTYYDNQYIITRVDDPNFIYINNIFVYEDIKNTAYYTVLSPDGYTESSPNYFDNYPVESLGDIANPVYLPLMGNKIGNKYSPSLSIEQNKNIIKSAISIYRIKGTILSIKRVMSTLNISCEVYEPYKSMLQYGKSSYGDQSHYQDWKLYHDGVFEIITDGVSLDVYKNKISSLVQPAGTRLNGRANINLGLLPVMGDILFKDSNSYFTELYVQAFKYGNLFDAKSSDRTRSGRTELEGLYADVSADLSVVEAFRKIWDSQIFSFSDFAVPIIDRVPAGSFSKNIGAYSSISNLVIGWTSPYDETTPLDVQLELIIKTLDERPARRSEFARRSGSESFSGLDGENWNWKPYTFFDSNLPIPMLPDDINIIIPIEIDMAFEGISTYTQTSGVILDENRHSSGQRNIYGIEIIIGHRFPTLEEWDEKVYWMFTDFTNSVSMEIGQDPFYQSTDVYKDAINVFDTFQTSEFDSQRFFSGNRTCTDIEILAE